ncbi:hypothetical protein [Pseudalkalibacillus sp. SCS-8]|uniref:hypothetical protein n=1 Tax=Pseudalkalibacillus nanhaiensis TaxID=3115291 RepID=UPI0032DAB21E
MKMTGRMWLSAVLGSIMLFSIVSLLLGEIHWYLLNIFWITALLINFTISYKAHRDAKKN